MPEACISCHVKPRRSVDDIRDDVVSAADLSEASSSDEALDMLRLALLPLFLEACCCCVECAERRSIGIFLQAVSARRDRGVQ